MAAMVSLKKMNLLNLDRARSYAMDGNCSMIDFKRKKATKYAKLVGAFDVNDFKAKVATIHSRLNRHKIK